jgi:DNA processing protein
MDNDSLAILLLSNRLVDTKEKPFTAKEIWNLRSRIPQLGRVLELSSEALMHEYELDFVESQRIKKLCDSVTALSFEIDRLEESGIKVLTIADDEFPQRMLNNLGEKSSVFLLVAGNINLLNENSRGIVGSRNASPETIETALLAARAAVLRGEHVVSGLAKGIDRDAMTAALEGEGNVVGIPSEGIRRVAKGNEIRNLVHEGRMCLVSPYGPDARFSVGSAMGRNRFIYALSMSTLVVASDVGKGGTWAGAEEALKNKFTQVDVWTGAGATKGNRGLVALGARAVSSVEEFWRDDQVVVDNVSESEQLKLF